jgi:uncharacterized protein
VVTAYLELLDAVEQGRFNSLEICPIMHYVRNVLTYERRNMCLRDCCGAATDLVSISVDGAIEACDCIRDPNLQLGSMSSGGILTALDSHAAQTIRKRSTRNLLPCRTCDWRVFCGGTCLARAGALDGVDDLQCQLSLTLFPEIFRRLAQSDRLEQYAKRFT